LFLEDTIDIAIGFNDPIARVGDDEPQPVRELRFKSNREIVGDRDRRGVSGVVAWDAADPATD
jgi:hypothetical protein